MTGNMSPSSYASFPIIFIIIIVLNNCAVQLVTAQCVGTCQMSESLQSVIDTQCSVCQHLSEADCRRHDPAVPCNQTTNCNATLHGTCTWSAVHGCRPVDITSPFLTLVEESQFVDEINSMILSAQDCINAQTNASCTAIGCRWNPQNPFDTVGMLPFGQESCQPFPGSSLTYIIGFPFQLNGGANTITEVDLWIRRARNCQSKNRSLCIRDTDWVAGSTRDNFPCKWENDDDADAFCDIDIELMVFAMAADAMPTGRLQSAFEGRVMCNVIQSQIQDGFCPSGQNCTQNCVDNPWCHTEYNDCQFSDSEPTNALADAALAYPNDPIAQWNNAKVHCKSKNCSRSACETALGGVCKFEVETTKNECKLDEIAWVISVGSEERAPASWVIPFVRALSECGDFDTAAECNGALHTYTSNTSKCVWQPYINGSRTGKCFAHFSAAFIPVIPETACAGGLASMIHTVTDCTANLNQQDCTNGSHSVYGQCEWNCGLCLPSIAFATTLNSGGYLPPIAYYPTDLMCNCQTNSCSTIPPNYQGNTAACTSGSDGASSNSDSSNTTTTIVVAVPPSGSDGASGDSDSSTTTTTIVVAVVVPLVIIIAAAAGVGFVLWKKSKAAGTGGHKALEEAAPFPAVTETENPGFNAPEGF